MHSWYPTKRQILFILGCSEECFAKVENDRYQELLNYMKIELGLNAGVFVFNLGNFLLTCLLSTGLIRQIFILKAFAVALLTLSRVAHMGIMSFTEDMEKRLKRPDLESMEALTQIFETFHQYLSMHLLFELHNLICKMERQEKSLVRLLIRVGAALTVIVAVIAVQCGIESILALYYDRSILIRMYDETKPFNVMMYIIFTLATIFYGWQSLAAISDSNRFREQCNISRRCHENQFVVRIIITFMASQVIKMIVQIVRAILDGFFSNAWYECQRSNETPYLTYVNCLEKHTFDIVVKQWVTKMLWFHLIEQVVVNIFLVYKQPKMGA